MIYRPVILVYDIYFTLSNVGALELDTTPRYLNLKFWDVKSNIFFYEIKLQIQKDILRKMNLNLRFTTSIMNFKTHLGFSSFFWGVVELFIPPNWEFLFLANYGFILANFNIYLNPRSLVMHIVGNKRSLCTINTL